jgi:hypothetical protein
MPESPPVMIAALPSRRPLPRLVSLAVVGLELHLGLGLLIWLMVLLGWVLLSVLVFGHTDFTFSLCVPRLGSRICDQLAKTLLS